MKKSTIITIVVVAVIAVWAVSDEETGETIFTHNPFSMPQGGMDSLLNKKPTEVLAYQYDLVCNGIELASGAVRNHDIDIMKKAFEIAGYGEDRVTGACRIAKAIGTPFYATEEHLLRD